jgi:hypothetical protein
VLRCGFFAALQKTVEDIGDLDAYALSQIRDRFTTLPLSLAHLPSLIDAASSCARITTRCINFVAKPMNGSRALCRASTLAAKNGSACIRFIPQQWRFLNKSRRATVRARVRRRCFARKRCNRETMRLSEYSLMRFSTTSSRNCNAILI